MLNEYKIQTYTISKKHNTKEYEKFLWETKVTDEQKEILLEGTLNESWYNTALDVIGLIPGIGEFADGLNGLLYLIKGNYLFAILSFLSMVPVVGDIVGKGAKVAIKLSKTGKLGAKFGKYLPKIMPFVDDIAKYATPVINKGAGLIKNSSLVPNSVKKKVLDVTTKGTAKLASSQTLMKNAFTTAMDTKALTNTIVKGAKKTKVAAKSAGLQDQGSNVNFGQLISMMKTMKA